MKLLTFQSPKVLDILEQNEDYFANSLLTREKYDYTKDIEQLEGANPIWCFKSVKDRDFTKEDFNDGSLFHRFICEMSLKSPEVANQFVLLELDVPDNLPKLGLTHNSYKGAVVIPSIMVKDLMAVYKLKYKDDHETLWYYPKVSVVETLGSNPLFTEDFVCRKQSKTATNIECDCGSKYYFDLGSAFAPDTLCTCSKCGKSFMTFANIDVENSSEWYTEYSEVDSELLPRLKADDKIFKVTLTEEDLI